MMTTRSLVQQPGTGTKFQGGTVQDWVERVKESCSRERIVHDIADVRDDARFDFVVQKLRKLDKHTGFLIAALHNAPNFRHFHIVHNCNYTNSCRCVFLKNLPLKRRSDKYCKIIYDVDNKYLVNLIEYLLQDEYFGGESWQYIDQTSGKVHFHKLVILYLTCGGESFRFFHSRN